MKEVFAFKPDIYGQAFLELLKEKRLNPLGPGSPNIKARSALNKLTIHKAFAPHEVIDTNMANACLAAVWLYQDFLQESHNISQTIHTQTGSCWHGIMHRLEPDFYNSKYGSIILESILFSNLFGLELLHSPPIQMLINQLNSFQNNQNGIL